MFKYSKRVPKDGSDAVGEILKAAADPKIISFAGGLPAPELFPVAEMKKATDDVYDENGKEALQYGSAKGVLKLRKTIAKRMLDREGIKTDPDHIMVSTGSEQVIDLVGKAFIDSGDTVFVEQPTYLCAIDVFKSYGAKFVSVPMDDDGMRTDALEEALKEHPEVKLLYTVPNFQNPTGRTMPADRREALAKLAEKYDFMVLEDNPYGDIRFAGEHVPSVKSFDKSGHVIYMSTFSKILAPGLRLGWAIADLDVINKLTVLKQSADLHSDNLAQYIVAKFFEENDIEKHIEKISQLYG
ncbi:aminotransferase, partial [Oenococcus alcoholitolerans]